MKRRKDREEERETTAQSRAFREAAKERKKQRALKLLADGDLTPTEIAQQLGISMPLLRRWKASK